MSDVARVYSRYLPEYEALMRRIEAEDRLIDMVVYRLHRFTVGEMAVVEEDD